MTQDTSRFPLNSNVLVYAADFAASRSSIGQERHACEIMLSEDMQDGGRLGGVTVLDPLVGELPEPVAALLR